MGLGLATMMTPLVVPTAMAPCVIDPQPGGGCCLHEPWRDPYYDPAPPDNPAVCWWACVPQPGHPEAHCDPAAWCWNPYVPEWTCPPENP